MFLKRGGNVTGLGPDYIISGPWPELTLLTVQVKQEPPFFNVNSGDHRVS